MMTHDASSVPSSILLVDKPTRWTSFDVVAKLRGVTGVKKIGHAGTLDPFATGLLIVAVGKEATKNIDQFVRSDKEYEATFVLGATSTTHDPEGKIVERDVAPVSRERVEAAATLLTGAIEQIPPMHSAIKIGGKRLYKLAREGKEVERQPRHIVVHAFDILDYAWPQLRVRVRCSSGTYIRALARDLGDALGVGAYVSQLRRTSIGNFSVNDAHSLNELTSEEWRRHLTSNL